MAKVKKINIEDIDDLLLSKNEQVQKGIAEAFKDDQLQITNIVSSNVKKRLELGSSLYDNITIINDILFSEEKLKNMTDKNLISLLSAQLKALSGVNVSSEEYVKTIETVNTQINILLAQHIDDATITPESRKKITDVLTVLTSKHVEVGDDNDEQGLYGKIK